MSKKMLIKVGLISILLFGALLAWIYYPVHSHVGLSTYFSYSNEELSKLKDLAAQDEMNTQELKDWDKVMFDLAASKSILLRDMVSEIYVYVYAAQREAAYLSYKLKGSWMGSLGPITAKVLCYFFPDQCPSLPYQTTNDKVNGYSEQLAAVVFAKIKARIETDKLQRHLYPPDKTQIFWETKQPFFGQDLGSWKPWLIDSVQNFTAPPPYLPNAAEWQSELLQVKEAVQNTTDEQKQRVDFWSAGPGTITMTGIWLTYGNDAIFQSNFSFEKILKARAMLAMTIMDALIVAYHNKYSYWTTRPFFMDPLLIKSLLSTNYPGYISGHSAVSAAVAVLLAYYFPDQKQKIDYLRDDAASSRYWGGMHFPIDSIQGLIVGEKIGNYIVSKENT